MTALSLRKASKLQLLAFSLGGQDIIKLEDVHTDTILLEAVPIFHFLV